MQSATNGLEVGDELFGGYRGEDSLLILQFQHPCIVDSVEDEGSCSELRLVENLIIRDGGPPGYLLFADDGSCFCCLQLLDCRLLAS